MFGTYCRLHVHVYDSDREVIRAASRKLTKRCRYSRKHREERHQFYRQMLAYHHGQGEMVREFRP